MKLDRYFYIPAAAVKAEVDAVKQKMQEYQAKRNAFLNEMGTDYYSLNYDQDAIVQIGYEYGVKMPDGLRMIREATIDEKPIRMVVPDKRTKAGKAIQKKLDALNEGGIAPFANITAAASRYGFDIKRCIQDNYMRHFYGQYNEKEDAYLLGVPSGEGYGTLKDDAVIPHFEEITELEEWEYIAITKGGKTLKELRKKPEGGARDDN